MKLFFLDTETNGFWNNSLELNDPYQGNIMQLAFQLYDENRKCVQQMCTLLKPVIPNLFCHEGAFKSHNISMDTCYEYGCDQYMVLSFFYENLVKSDIISGYSVNFDINMIVNQFKRVSNIDISEVFNSKKIIDVMRYANPIVNAISKKTGRKKAPTLSECSIYFFNEEIKNAHNALVDVEYCAKVFYELVDRKVINL